MLPRAAPAPARRRGADALPGLRVTATAADAPSRRDRTWRAAAAAASGLLLALALPPASFGLLALVALVPLLWAWRGATSRNAAISGLAFGIVYFGVVFEWSRYFGLVAIVPFVLANTAYVVAAGALLGAFTKRGVRSPFLVAAIWVVFEGLRARWPLGGLPWGEVGLTLHDQGWGRALATWGGIPLASFLVVALNGWLLELGIAAVKRRRVLVPAGAVLGIVVVIVAASALRPEPTVTGKIRFALLQGNDQNRDLTIDEQVNDYLTKAHFALAAQLEGKYDLVVFPESALERDPERSPVLRQQIVALADRLDATVVVNARTAAPDDGLYNANLVYEPGGKLQGQYAKRHLVPFGEYVPLRGYIDWIPGVSHALDQVSFDYTAGHGRTQFTAGGHPFETAICFESAFPSVSRDAVRDGAELLVVSTNNRSYRRSGLSAQHVALSQMRAAETGRPVLHAAISGISAVIEPDGSVRERTALFEKTITDGTIATTSGTTPFVRFGDWVLAACLVGVLVTAVVAQRRWSRQHRP
ncbi:MAG: apolipoprotein N-acyltransferase [Acidimicrobiia bacterium]